MQIKALSDHFKLPEYATPGSAALDIFMPSAGRCYALATTKVALGFAAAVPPGYVALLVPRSGIGFKHGLELNNTCGVIDSDYRGEWFASLRLKPTLHNAPLEWEAGDRLLQVLIVPVVQLPLELVTELDTTQRGEGGLGSSGK